MLSLESARTRTVGHFEASRARLDEAVLALARTVESAVDAAVRAFSAGDVAGATAVIEGDRRVAVQATRLDEDCLKILALYRPTGRDLRILASTLKTVHDLEKVAELGARIAEQTLEGKGPIPEGAPAALADLAERVRGMLEGAVTALVSRDVRLADAVLEAGAAWSERRLALEADLKSGLKAHPDGLPAMLRTLFVVEHLDRIERRATNAAEDVVYLLEETILRRVC